MRINAGKIKQKRKHSGPETQLTIMRSRVLMLIKPCYTAVCFGVTIELRSFSQVPYARELLVFEIG